MIVKHIYRNSRWPTNRTGCRDREECVRLLSYLLRPQASPEVLRNDFVGTSPEEIADELSLFHRSQKYFAYHVVASYPEEEHELWRPHAARCIEELQSACNIPKGFWVQHKGHWHGFLMAMKPTGGTVRLGTVDSDGNSVPVALAFRQLAERWEDATPGAQKTGRDRHHQDLDRGVIAQADREFARETAATPIPNKVLLRAAAERVIEMSDSLDAMKENAAAAGIEVHVKTKDGTPIGISFARDGIAIRGRDVGYSYQKLLSYYENKRTQPLCRDHRLAGEIIPVNRNQSHSGGNSETGRADLHPAANSRRGATATPEGRRTLSLPEEALRFLAPRTSLLDLMLQLTGFLGRLCTQVDYRRRWHPTQTEPPTL